jgi:neurofibromin 1
MENYELQVCLNPQSSSLYHYVLVCSLYKIVTQPRLSWWPEVHILYSKAPELRAMFLDTFSKVSQTFQAHTPLKMIQVSYRFCSFIV